eukprot:CAMPEP_0116876940 /NCGR_PEP_ID=MMETSP0463-20121206/8789_1 /TAXON_ID=181622 /ORGANISM="Strombidinopsis sp, Strain SopsisLIS2011" /LENGTH=78 /DNA_ID=CAMNT_0004523861 /DNA_START=23 /DNA_END=259 /DNA_ORIENTATION=+
MDDIDEEMIDNTLEAFETFEDYLDDRMSPEDLFYLEDQELARQLMEVGFHGKGSLLTRDQFIARKQAYNDAKKNKTSS